MPLGVAALSAADLQLAARGQGVTAAVIPPLGRGRPTCLAYTLLPLKLGLQAGGWWVGGGLAGGARRAWGASKVSMPTGSFGQCCCVLEGTGRAEAAPTPTPSLQGI